MVLLLALKPVSRFERRLLDSRNHVNLRLITLLRVLQVQLVKAIGLQLVSCVGSLFFEDRIGYGLFPYSRGVARDPDIVYILKTF